MKRLIVRIGAALALAGLCWWVWAATGYIEIVLLMLVAALLGGVVARPKRVARFRPTYWEKREVTIPRGD